MVSETQYKDILSQNQELQRRPDLEHSNDLSSDHEHKENKENQHNLIEPKECKPESESIQGREDSIKKFFRDRYKETLSDADSDVLMIADPCIDEKSVAMEDSFCMSSYEKDIVNIFQGKKHKRISKTENGDIIVSKPTLQAHSAYSKLSTKEGTLQLQKGEIEENIIEDEGPHWHKLSPIPSFENKGRESNLINRQSSFQVRMPSKKEHEDAFFPIQEEEEEKVYYKEVKVHGVIKRKYEWNFD